MNQVTTIISETIDVLANKFGATGTQLWEILIKQSMIDGYKNLIASIIFLAILIAGIILIKKAIKLNKKNEYDENCEWFLGIGIIFIVVGFIISIITTCATIDNLANPEYQAIQSILQKTE